MGARLLCIYECAMNRTILVTWRREPENIYPVRRTSPVTFAHVEWFIMLSSWPVCFMLSLLPLLAFKPSNTFVVSVILIQHGTFCDNTHIN